MANKKESFFWTSYSDLMTSLFFVMLVLFVLVIVLLHQRMRTTEAELTAIKEVQESTKDLDSTSYFDYKDDYKKYVLKIQVRYPRSVSNINQIQDVSQLSELKKAGWAICDFLKKHEEHQYLLIIEGQASKDNFSRNYELSYERALSLMRYWIEESHIVFGDNCEILISGSGDGKLDTHSMREDNEVDNQRFLIHILPKNILENETNNKKHAMLSNGCIP